MMKLSGGVFMDEAIVAENLTKRHGELVAVNHASFNVEKSDFLAF